MNLKEEFFKTVEYRITEGSDYCWQCYGDNAYTLDSWDGEQDGHSFSIIFDTKTQTVYELQAHDYTHTRAYRWINPEFKSAFEAEGASRGVNNGQAWDDLEYVDLEVVEDFFEKMTAIHAGLDYDTRVQVPVDFSDEELLTYMKLAHERDITFNQLVEQCLREVIDQLAESSGHDFPVNKKKKKNKKRD
jgi:hypothetical protein